MNQNEEVWKALFISISSVERFSNTGVDQLAGYMRRKGFEVDIAYFHRRETNEQIKEHLKKTYNVYGFSVVGPNYLRCVELANYIKEIHPKSYIVFGGAFASMYYKEMLSENESIDYITLGDGEIPTFELFSYLRDHHPLDSINVASINDLEGKQAFFNSIIEGHPAYDYYENDTLDNNRKKTHSMLSKTNVCTGHCTFCFERKGAINFRSLTEIVDEIEYVSQKYGIIKFYFCDDDLMDPNDTQEIRKRMTDFCKMILQKRLNLVFSCFIKAVSFRDNNEDRELLKLMSKAGFASMFVGIEAANDIDLKIYNKKARTSDNFTIIRLLRDANIYPVIGFINLNPYSTPLTIKTNLSFLLTQCISKVALYVSILRPYKNTPIYRKMVRDGLLSDSYTFMDYMEYRFVDNKVGIIGKFISEELFEDIDRIPFFIEWVEELYYECIHVNSECQKYWDIIEFYRRDQQRILKQYFEKLYLDFDLKWCKANKNMFLNYFYDKENIYRELYDSILELYKNK